VTDEGTEFVAGMKAVRFIRCMKHREVGQYNSNEATGAECPPCHVEQLVAWQEATVQRLRALCKEAYDELGINNFEAADLALIKALEVQG